MTKRALIKAVKVGTQAPSGAIYFDERMAKYVGKVFEFKPRNNTKSKWIIVNDTPGEPAWAWHISWLDFDVAQCVPTDRHQRTSKNINFRRG